MLLFCLLPLACSITFSARESFALKALLGSAQGPRIVLPPSKGEIERGQREREGRERAERAKRE